MTSHCTYCPPPPKLATVVKRKALPRALRRLIGSVQAAKHNEWSSLHAMHGGFSSKVSSIKGTGHRIAFHLAADARVEWLNAIMHLLNWSRS